MIFRAAFDDGFRSINPNLDVCTSALHVWIVVVLVPLKSMKLGQKWYKAVMEGLLILKHEYLRSRAYICLSLSSPFLPSVIVVQIWPLSRYSCCYLGSLHPRNFMERGALSEITNHLPNFLKVKSEQLKTHFPIQINFLWKIPWMQGSKIEARVSQ